MKNLLKLFFLIIFIVNTAIPCLYGEVKENEELKAAYFPNLIPNPGLEEDNDDDLIPDFWKIEGFEQKEGLLASTKTAHRGNKSISINGKGVWHCTAKDIEPRKYYLFSFWVKRDGWIDSEYPTIQIFDKKMYLDELFSWGAWMRMSWYLNSEEMRQAEIKLINPGMSHRIYFDDIELIKYDIDLLLPEDNFTLNTSLPEFVWRIPGDDKILDLKIELSRNDDFKDKIVLSTINALGSSFKIREKLGTGDWYWRIKVYKNNNVIASSETRSFSVKSDPFPIGIYGATEDVFGELKEAGFNCVLASSTKDYVLSAKENGLKCIVRIPGKSTANGLDVRIKKLVNTNNILCWYLDDEPEGRGVSPIHIWKWGNYIHSFDENQLTGLALLRSKKASDYGDAVDVLMVDTYPIPRRPMTWLSDSIDESSMSMSKKGKQVWAVIQAFGWRYVRDSPKLKNAKNPTLEEERCLTYLAIVHGAKGILYFTYSGGKYEIKDFPEHWNDVKRIASELNILSPVLTAPDANSHLVLNLTSDVSAHVSRGPKGTDLKKQFTSPDDSQEGDVENSNSSLNTQIYAVDANGEPAIHYMFKDVNCELLNESKLFKVVRKDMESGNEVAGIIDGKTFRFIIAVNVINTAVDAAFHNELLQGNSASVLFEGRNVK
ncbi:MAG: hypothetical protein ACE5H1_03115, partial [Thermodesulfobacteriota bacterium]